MKPSRVLLVLVSLAPSVGLALAQQNPGSPAAGRQAAEHARGASPSDQGALALPLCAPSIKDQASPAACLQASSVPASGLLFPGPHLGGVDNVQSGTNSFVGGGQQNQATNAHTAIGGGRGNSAAGEYAVVGGGRSNSASGPYSAIGGGNGNSTSMGGVSGTYATIGGGRSNTAVSFCATASGGRGNEAQGGFSAIGGGRENIAAGETCTIGGGADNYAAGEGAVVSGGGANSAWSYSAVGGGSQNEAYAYFATVSGGHHNVASGGHSAVAGGNFNSASGDFSFAAGRRAKATHRGAFVWGDSLDADKSSSAADEFNVYASGGARIFSNATATAGVLLAPGAGSWSTVSDRDAKENVEPVDAAEVLARVAALPISTWSYEAQDDSIRHMGPMAQDFHAAFGLGVSERTIDTVDPDGVALAAIQGLHRLVQAKDDRIRALEERVTRLESLLARPGG